MDLADGGSESESDSESEDNLEADSAQRLVQVNSDDNDAISKASERRWELGTHAGHIQPLLTQSVVEQGKKNIGQCQASCLLHC